MTALIALVGKRCGRWTVQDRAPNRKGMSYWFCICDCGTKRVVQGHWLKRAEEPSCGCRQREVAAARATKHGHTKNGQMTVEYLAWCSMKARCGNPKNISYHCYGARGITVCKRWRRSFTAFFKDMGPRPTSRYTVERTDNTRGYSKENCVWATWKEQARNKRSSVFLLIDGKRKTLAEWLEIYGVTHGAYYGRLERGWSLNDTIKTPLQGVGRKNRRATKVYTSKGYIHDPANYRRPREAK